MKLIVNQRNDENLKQFNFKNWKINISNKNVGARTKIEWSKLKWEENGHNVTNTVTKKNNSSVLKFKSQKKIKKNEYIRFFSNWDKENTKCHPRQNAILLNRTNKTKKQFKQTKNWNIFETFKTEVMKKFNFFSKT